MSVFCSIARSHGSLRPYRSVFWRFDSLCLMETSTYMSVFYSIARSYGNLRPYICLCSVRWLNGDVVRFLTDDHYDGSAWKLYSMIVGHGQYWNQQQLSLDFVLPLSTLSWYIVYIYTDSCNISNEVVYILKAKKILELIDTFRNLEMYWSTATYSFYFF